MKLKLKEKLTYKGADNQEFETNYIYIKKPTIAILSSNDNLGLYSDLLSKFYKHVLLGQKALKDAKLFDLYDDEEEKTNKEQELEENIEKTKEEIEQSMDKNMILISQSYIQACLFSGYEKVYEDLLNKGPKYFDKLLFLDEELTKSISLNNAVRSQLKSHGDLIEIYEAMIGFFFQIAMPSSQRKIEL